MNTWPAQAAHVTLVPGLGPPLAFDSAFLYSFALGASVVLLALVVMKSPGQLNLRSRPSPRWRPRNRWQRVVALAGERRTSRSRFRRRIDHLLVHMLGDLLDEQPQSRRRSQDESRPSGRSAAKAGRTASTGPIGTTNRSTGSYQSKHRLSEPRKEPQSPKPAPRHAAPPPASHFHRRADAPTRS